MKTDLKFLLDYSVWESLMDINEYYEDSDAKKLMFDLFIKLSEAKNIQLAVITPELLEILNDKYKGKRTAYEEWIGNTNIIPTPDLPTNNLSYLEVYLVSAIRLLIDKGIEKDRFFFVINDKSLIQFLNNISNEIGRNMKVITCKKAREILKKEGLIDSL